MSTIPNDKPRTGTWKNGQIILDEPADWSEGCRVVVTPGKSLEVYGMSEEEQSNDPEAIARWLAEFDAIPPWQMTAEEEAEWQAARQAVEDYTIAKMRETFPEKES
jgi:hypothetical protein